MTLSIRAATPADAAALARIYNFYVRQTAVTFEEDEVSDEEMCRRIDEVQSAALPWLIAAEEDRLAGYAFGTKWKTRSGYRFAVEVSVYLDPAFGGRGIGSALYSELLPSLKSLGLHAAIGGIALPNEASIALHEKFGFRNVAHFRETGFKFGQWIDVGYWERLL